ncbi:ABC transporter permease subunit [Pseudactinotalea suaedae]|uniref:ABC transporter permease subunit n=1 Tax=Pseudactinotalea suaedae TaxID=1524924 RepID=UPI0012E1C555|nr:ABC transporter permease subunit [Pseudactinotalea suaedae]
MSVLPALRRRRTAWIAALLVALAVAGNLAVLAWDHARAQAGQVRTFAAEIDDIGAVAALDDTDVAVAGLGTRVSLVREGAVVVEVDLDARVSAIAAEPGSIVVGTATGEVLWLDPRLQVTDRAEVDGSVVALAQAAQTTVAASGSGAYSRDYQISRWTDGRDAGAAGAAYTVSAITVLGEHAVYGTTNGSVGAVDDAGSEAWLVGLGAPVTAVLAVPDRGLVAVGDQDGRIHLIDSTGQALGSVRVSAGSVSAMVWDPEHEYYLVGDSRGALHVLDVDGRLISSRTLMAAPIRGVVDTTAGTILAGEDGSWLSFDVDQVAESVARDAVRPWWIAGNVVAAMALALLLGLGTAVRRRSAGLLARRVWGGRVGYALVGAAVLGVLVFCYYPVASALWYSLTNFSLRELEPEFIGLDNYIQILFHDRYFRIGLWNMLIITVASLVKTIAVPLLAAELVYWVKRSTTQYVFRTVFVMSTVVPGLVTTLLWKRVYDPDVGALNQLLRLVGLDDWTRAWLADEGTALGAVIAVGFPYLAAFPFLILLGGLIAINRDLYDSAALDGAGRWLQFRHIDLAHLRPQFRILAFFAVTGAVEGFASTFLLTRGGPGTATYVPALQMYLRIAEGDLGYASAIGAILVIGLLAISVVILRFRRNELEAS